MKNFINKIQYQKIIYTIIITSSILLISWGREGHEKISRNSTLSFPSSMDFLVVWADSLAKHGSDADSRKSIDTNESPKHYIDIDNYEEFNLNGKISQNYDSIIAKHGYKFVIENGTLPWATRASYDSLVSCFKRKNWHKAMLFASDLGHYVGDGYMPLHLTENYNGQSTGQKGIHSRYESHMINSFISEINYKGGNVSYIKDVDKYIFKYIYTNHKYKDSVLQAEVYARTISGGKIKSNEYTDALWEKTKKFTVRLFKKASISMAELIYTAWVQAGSPKSNDVLLNYIYEKNSNIFNIYTNIVESNILIKYHINKDNSNVLLNIFDVKGNKAGNILNEIKTKGIYNTKYTNNKLNKGVYYCVLKENNQTTLNKIILF